MRVGPELRDAIKAAREDTKRWGTGKKLTQAEAALRIGKSQVWWRQIETGYTRNADPATVATMCEMLGISPAMVRGLGEPLIADIMEGFEMVREDAIPDRVINARARREDTEDHIRRVPGLDMKEADTLIQILRTVRGHEEPFGKDLWRRRKSG